MGLFKHNTGPGEVQVPLPPGVADGQPMFARVAHMIAAIRAWFWRRNPEAGSVLGRLAGWQQITTVVTYLTFALVGCTIPVFFGEPWGWWGRAALFIATVPSFGLAIYWDDE